ncbi:MAG: 50S ribosomal protein L4 [Butyricicoccus sp.]
MPTVKVYNMAGQETGELELNAAVFGIEPNVPAMHAVVKNYLANCRQGTQSTLTRSEVRGGGIKPWRQKGTGRARQGSIRAPQWTHGGIALGPKPRTYRYSLNKKLKRLAMLSALSTKAAAGEIVVIDSLEMNEIKTKSFANFLKAVDCSDAKSLVVTPEVKTNIVKSAANIPGVRTTIATTLNVYDILNAEMFIVDKAAIAKIEEVFA